MVMLTACVSAPSRAEDSFQLARDLRALSIEELATIEVTSVSKRPEPIGSAPAAIYVITNDDIRRSAATSLPEALRLAPNLHVGQVSGFHYAISARGFNSFTASNKLLVLIDGRSVYTPLHSGVYWDAQDVMLDDVDRIEVISGPGGTLWGANAVNGVINIVTRRPADTQGAHLSIGGGNVNQDVAARYGGTLGANTAYRAYVKGFKRGHTLRASGADGADAWRRIQGGFATDWRGESDTATVQGDIYTSEYDAVADSEISGANLLARWTHAFAAGQPLMIQAYYDRTRRVAPPGIDEVLETYDLGAQHGLRVGTAHSIVWGGGYRQTRDSFANGSAFILVPEKGTLHIGNIFVQDEIALRDDLALTVGTKVEHHTYTGFEVMPNARLAWKASDTMLLWAAISRAVRTPARTDRELVSRTAGFLAAATGFRSETVTAYEAGYRGQPFANTTLSVSAFYNVYDDLRTTAQSPSSGRPFMFDNGMAGRTYGVEAWGSYGVSDRWRLGAGVNVLHKDLGLKPGHTDTSGLAAAGNDPEYQLSARSQMNLLPTLELDIGLRAVDDLKRPAAAGYVELDARVGWHVTDTVELSVAGANLLHRHHLESVASGPRGEARRSVYASARLKF